MDSDTLTISQYAVKVLSTEDLIGYANKKLDGGTYSDHLLSIIDQEYKDWNSTANYFEKFCTEQGLKIPSFDDAIMQLIKFHLKAISIEKHDPLERFGMLLEDIEHYDFYGVTKKYVGDSIGIHYLYGLYYEVDDLSDDEKEKGLKEIKERMIEESSKWLENHQKV